MSILWIPYIGILFNWFNKPEKRIYVIGMILIAGTLGYKLPIPTTGMRISLYHMGLFVTMASLVLTHLIYKVPILKSSKIINWRVKLFTAIWVLSVFLNYRGFNTIPQLLDMAISYSFLFFITSYAVKTSKDFIILLEFIITCSLIFAVIGIIQFYSQNDSIGVQATRQIDYSGDFFFKDSMVRGYGVGFNEIQDHKFRIRSTAKGSNPLAGFMVLSIPISIFFMIKKGRRKKQYIVFGTILCLQLLTLLMAGSRGAIIALLFGIVYYFRYSVFDKYSKKYVFVAIFILGALFLIYIFQDIYYQTIILSRLNTLMNFGSIMNLGSRFGYWKHHIESLNIRPIVLGYGFPGAPGSEAHNNWLGILYHSGIWGFTVYVSIIWYFFRSLWRGGQINSAIGLLRTIFIIWLILSMPYHTSFSEPSLIFWTILGGVGRMNMTNWSNNL